MKKIILKIILSIFLFFGLSNLVNASIENFNKDTQKANVEYTDGLFTLTYFGKTPQLFDFSIYGGVEKMLIYDLSFRNNIVIAVVFGNGQSQFLSLTNQNGSSYVSVSKYPIKDILGMISFSSVSVDKIFCLENFSNSNSLRGGINIDFTNNTSYCSGYDFILENGQYTINGEIYGGTLTTAQTCETRLINTPYKISFTYESGVDEVISEINVEDEKYFFEYKKPNNNTNTMFFQNIEDLVFNNDNKTSFSFNSLENPLEDTPILIIQSDLSNIDYLKLSGSGTQATIQDCTGNKVSNQIYNFDYSEEFKKLDYENSKCIMLKFEKDYSDENNIIIEWGEKYIQVIDSEVCWDNEKPDEIIINGTSFSGSIVDQVKNDGTLDDDGIGYDPNNIRRIGLNGEGAGTLVFGSIRSPDNNSEGTCEMFDETGHFTYYSNGQVSFNFGFDDYSSFDFGFINLTGFAQGTVETISSPINSFISLVGIITPFGETPKDYCLFGTIVPYQNHRLFKDTIYYNELNFITYLILFGLYAGIFSKLFGFRNMIGGGQEMYNDEVGNFKKANNNRINGNTEKLRQSLRKDRLKDVKSFVNNNNT